MPSSERRFAGHKPGPGDLLHLIRDTGPITRSELGERSGLGRSTVAQRVEILLSHALIREESGGRSTGGRPPQRIAFNPEAGLILAADLGATHARLALSDLTGEARVEETADIQITAGPDEVLGEIEQRFDALLAAAGESAERVWAVGVGVPGPVEHATGRPVSPPIMSGWDGYSIPDRLGARFPVPVLVDNDANIMALGEHASECRDCDNLLFVKIGTGIGCGVMVDGDVYRGAQGAAGDIGHVPVAGYLDVTCECGNEGCLEALASGRALARAARERGLDAHDGRDVVALVKAQEVIAVQLVREAGRLLGGVLAGFVNGLNPDVIVIGGDVAQAREQLFAGVRETVYQRSTALATRELRIIPSALGDRAGVIGATLMAAEHVLSPAVLDDQLDPTTA